MEDIRKRTYKRTKKTTIQLTSLLDLLFVMIFVSLIQQKTTPEMMKQIKKKPGTITHIKTKKKVKTKKVTKPTPALSYTIDATFHFHPTATNRNIPSGKYQMKGSFDEKTRKLQLGGVSWIDRPKNYDMVPLSGTIEKTGKVFMGRVEFPGCQQFTLKKSQSSGSKSISGVWEGIYNCSQGETGLTLTIQ